MSFVRELAQIHVELYHPGDRIRGPRNIQRYLEWNRRNSRLFLIPSSEPHLMLEDRGDHAMVTRAFAAVQIQAIGETFTGSTSGILDELCVRDTPLKTFASCVQDFIDYALLNTQGRAYKAHTWIGVFDLDEEGGTILYMGPIDLGGIMVKIGS